MPWLYKQKGSDNWWLGYRMNGKQVLESTKTSDRAKAEKILAKMEAGAAAHRARAPASRGYPGSAWCIPRCCARGRCPPHATGTRRRDGG